MHVANVGGMAGQVDTLKETHPFLLQEDPVLLHASRRCSDKDKPAMCFTNGAGDSSGINFSQINI